MTIRSATEADVEAIRAVAERSWTTDYPDILTRETAEAAVTDWYAPEEIAAELRDSRTLVLVAERGGDVVGFAHATWLDADREGYVLRLYVHPEHRRAGLGRELLEATCEGLAERGVERVNAMVLSANERGRAFYDAFGFEHVDERPTIVGDERYPESRYVLRSTTADGTDVDGGCRGRSDGGRPRRLERRQTVSIRTTAATGDGERAVPDGPPRPSRRMRVQCSDRLINGLSSVGAG